MLTDQYYEKVTIGDATLYCGDCLDVLPTLGKFDAVITDPPYGKVRGDFDDEWTNRNGMLGSAEKWRDAIFGVMKPNATLWWFAWPSLAGRIESMLSDKLNVLAHVVWQKPTATGMRCCKEALRAPMPMTERIIMAEHYGADNMALGESGYQAQCDKARGFVFEPLRAYLAGEWRRAGLIMANVDEACGTVNMGGHYFRTSQWQLPTPEHYSSLQRYANKDGGQFLTREYEELRKEYEELRKEYEELRRWFDCRNGDQFSDVWSFPAANERHGHPTQKPVNLMDYMVRLSVRHGGVCIDPFMGSGTTGVACTNLGRGFVGIERDKRYFDIACKRIEDAYRQSPLIPHDAPSDVANSKPSGLF